MFGNWNLQLPFTVQGLRFFMEEYFLRRKFTYYVLKNWHQNNHKLKDIPCVYALISFSIESSSFEIAYIGSTTKLLSRYKSHKIPTKIQESGKCSLLYYKPLDKGFYDYEMKLIRKLKPRYNKQHKHGS